MNGNQNIRLKKPKHNRKLFMMLSLFMCLLVIGGIVAGVLYLKGIADKTMASTAAQTDTTTHETQPAAPVKNWQTAITITSANSNGTTKPFYLPAGEKRILYGFTPIQGVATAIEIYLLPAAITFNYPVEYSLLVPPYANYSGEIDLDQKLYPAGSYYFALSNPRSATWQIIMRVLQ